MPIHSFYDQWPQYNRRLTDVVAGMTPEQLATKHPQGEWPIWATVAHTAGARVYWLCVVMGEPGLDTTPFEDPASMGWEDDLDTPRYADELVPALDTTWDVVAGVLSRWAPDTLSQTITREYGDVTQQHSKGSVLQRLFSHDAYHCGELSQTLGILGWPQIDLWRSE